MIERMPKAGDKVQCPEDRKQPAYSGTISYVGPHVYTNIHGVRYVWCAVCGPDHISQWPSHRLGYKLPEDDNK